MSLKSHLYCLLFALLLLPGSSESQMFSDQGLLSGSGLSILPTASIAPPLEYRVQFSRINYLKGNGRGINIVSLTAGLSSTLEGYVRFHGEQTGSFSSQVAYGFGGKFRVPVVLPVIRRLALWADLTSTDQTIASALFPSDAFRTGMTATLDSNGFLPSLFLGTASINSQVNPLIGGGVTIAVGTTSQIGFELVHGYLGRNSIQFAATGSMRVFPNIGIQIIPGYLSLPKGSTWTISIGISCSTTDLNFHPVIEGKKGDEFILPSIEEIEKQEQQQEKPAGSGLNPDGSLGNDREMNDGSTEMTPVSQGVGTKEPVPQNRLFENILNEHQTEEKEGNE